MIILKTYENVSIGVDNKWVVGDKKHNDSIFKIIFQNRLYENACGGWKCVSDPEQRPLYSHLRCQYEDNKNAIRDEFEKVKAQFSAEMPAQTPAPAPAPVQTPAPATPGLGGKLEEILMKTIAEQSIDEIIELAKPMLEKHIVDTFGVLPEKHEVVTPKGTHEVEGVTHECFDKVLNLVNLDIPVFLTGGAGTGKNVICKQISDGLGLDFYFTNAVTQEYQLKGFIDANGTYHETQFFKAFTRGGLFFLDEMDGSIPETLIILNSAIANRYFDFPTGKFEAHPDFRIISAGNTIGTGADIEYTGRFQLDASSLDRFALVKVDYSEKIEKAVSGNNDELCSFAHEFRKVTEKSGIRCLCTYRAIERISKLEDCFNTTEAIQMSLTKGLSKEDVHIIVKGFESDNFYNKYSKALRELGRGDK